MPPHPLALPNRDFAFSCTHFLTVTLKPELYSNQIRQQYRKTYNVLTKFLQSHCDKYLLVTELTKECNVHYHIILKLSALVYEGTDLSDMNFLNDFKTLKPFGFKKLEVIQSIDNVYNYLVKDIKKTHGVINPSSKTALDVWYYWVKSPIPAPQTTLKPLRDDYNPMEDTEYDNVKQHIKEQDNVDDWFQSLDDIKTRKVFVKPKPNYRPLASNKYV